MRTIEKILVPIDFADCSKRALELALQIAQPYGAKIRLLYAWRAPEAFARREAQAALADFLAQVDNPADVPLECDIVDGVPEEVITERAKDYDLVVMGTHGRRGFAHAALGSVTEKVIRACSRPVLVVNMSTR